MTHETMRVANEIWVLSATVCEPSMEGTYRRYSVGVFTSSYCHEKDKPYGTRDTAPGVDWSIASELYMAGKEG